MQVNDEALTGGLIGTAVSGASIGMATNEIALWVGIVTSIVGLLITIVTAIIIPIIQWRKKAMEDGKVTADELGELNDTIKQGTETVNKEIEKMTGKDDKQDE